jgi:hypothetical protein
MRRLAALLALAALGLVAGALTAQALRAQDVPDSALVARGCRVTDGAASPAPSVYLDSAGIRVTQGWGALAPRPDGTALVCPTGVLAFTFTRGLVTWRPGDAPYLQATDDTVGLPSAWRLDVSPRWQATPEEAAGRGHVGRWTAWTSWRDAVPVLAAQLHDGATPPTPPTPPTPVPPIVPPPVVVPPVVPPVPADPCAAAPSAWLPLTDGSVRRDEVRLPRCAAVVVLDVAADARAVTATAPVRWVVFWPPCGGPTWRRHGTTYTTRTAALDRARRVPVCAATAAPLPSTRSAR